MGPWFFVFAVVACLLWSAVFTAAAGRTRPGWIRWLLTSTAVIVPVVALAPLVVITADLAFHYRLETNWFAAALTAVISALIGGGWIAWAGLAPRAAPVAAAWPLVGLAATFVLAKAMAAGALFSIDSAVAAEGRLLRVEAAQIMALLVAPAPAADDNAAPLYLRAFQSLPPGKMLREVIPFPQHPLTADPASPAVAAILERYAPAVELLRRAADRPGCRFDRDWSRPSLDMLLPELQEVRAASWLVMLAARRAAAAGDGDAALADVVRIHRMGRHVAGEPFLVSGLVGEAIDTLALETLADVLPSLGREDLPLLDRDSFRDFVGTPIRYQRAFLGEEAFGLATIADLADDGLTAATDHGRRATTDVVRQLPPVYRAPTMQFLYRCFLLRSDTARYRAILRRCQVLAAVSGTQPFPVVARDIADIEADLRSLRAGTFASLLAPAVAGVLTSQAQSEAVHAAAGVLVAATRARLTGTPLGESLVPDAIPALPGDPFTENQPLLARRVDDGWVVYSVGPDGEDDGGPPPMGEDRPRGNDDIGLRLAF
jgi:hypothetical protein